MGTPSNPAKEPQPEVQAVATHLNALRSAVPAPTDLAALRGTLSDIEARLAQTTGELGRLTGDHDAALELVNTSAKALDGMDISTDALSVLEQIGSANQLLQEVLEQKTALELLREEHLRVQGETQHVLKTAEETEQAREARLADQTRFEERIGIVGREFAAELLLDEETTYGADAILDAIASWDKSIADAQAHLHDIDFDALEKAIPGLRAEIQTIEARLEGVRTRLEEITAELKENPLTAVTPASPAFTALLVRKTELTSEGVPLKGKKETDEALLLERRDQLRGATQTLDARGLLVQAQARRSELAERLKTLLPQETALVGVEEESDLMALDWDSLGLSVPGFTVPGMPVAPVLETIAVLREKGAPLSARTTEGLAFLAGFAPKMSFEGLRPEELDQVVRSLTPIATGRKDVKEVLFDLASGMLRMRDLPDPVRRFAQELVKRFDEEVDYAPQDATIRLLVRGALEAYPNLLKRNMDLNSFDPNDALATGAGTTPFEQLRQLLVLRELQNVHVRERQPLTVEAYLKPVSELIRFHAELILKFQKNGLRLSDFLPEESRKAVFDGIRFLVSVQAYMLANGAITTPQQDKVKTIMAEYVGLVETTVNSDERLAQITLEEIHREERDVESAAMELRLIFNDFPGRLAKRGNPLFGNTYSFLVLNKVLVGMGCPAPANPERKPVSLIQDEEMYKPHLQRYLSANATQRAEVREKALSGATNDYEQHIMNEAFEIIDQYAPTDV